MKAAKRRLWLLLVIASMLAFPSPSYASPGQITINGYTYGTSAFLNIDSYYPSSTAFPSGRMFNATFDNYVYRFSSGYSGTLYIAFQSVATGNVIASPANIGNNATFDIFLNGDYIVHTFQTSSPPNPHSLSITARAPGSIDIFSPAPQSYLLKGSTHKIEAFITGSPTSVVATAINGSGVSTTLGSLSQVTGTRYELNHTFNTHFTVGSGPSMALPKLRVTATYPSGTVYSEIPFYVTYETAGFYQSVDTTWTYTSPTNHRFLAPANNEQMCYEYVVGEWSTVEPFQPDNYIIDFMLKQGIYSGRAGIKYNTYSFTFAPYPDAIYYNGFHFGKVTAWDASGNPTEVRSKWGPYETIKSTSAAPFATLYGSPRIYFWD